MVHERAVEVAPARPHHILKAAPRASAFGATKATRGEGEGGPAAQRASYINALPRHRGATILLLPSLASCLSASVCVPRTATRYPRTTCRTPLRLVMSSVPLLPRVMYTRCSRWLVACRSISLMRYAPRTTHHAS